MATIDTTGLLLEIDQLKDNRETLSDIIDGKERVLYDAMCHNAHNKFHNTNSFPGWEYVKKCDITCMSTLRMFSHYADTPETCLSRLPLPQLAYLVAQLRTVISPGDRRVSVISPIYHNGTSYVEKSRKHLLRDHVIFLCDYGCDNCGIVSHTTDICMYSNSNQPMQYQPIQSKHLPQISQPTKTIVSRNKNRNRRRNKINNTSGF